MRGVKPRLSLVTCRELPEPDTDADLLVDAFAGAGVDARWVSWDGPGAELAPVAVIRSTWNYHRHVEQFLAWTDNVPARLWNPPAVVRWNVHKGYLLDLASQGVATVPTALVRRGEAVDLAALAATFGTDDVVIKPAVSAGSYRTFRSGGALESLRGELLALVRDEDTLIQPYMPAVEGEGERSFIWIDGEVTHAVRKSPRFSGDDEATVSAPVTEEARAFGARVLAAAPGPLLYARIDTVRGDDGALRLMELEAIEPSLFLRGSATGLWRFVDAVSKLVLGRRHHFAQEVES
jgi:glutathione synthase/RimK-type ligase-like ATP-grasp enzyme